MPVDCLKLQKHLDDYGKLHGREQRRFVCPITLEERDEADLVDGHVLNKSFIKASRRTVIQYRSIDEFYGTRVEESLVHFLNLSERSELEMFRLVRNLTAKFSDGTEAGAFVAGSESSAKADGVFPLVARRGRDGSIVGNIYVRTAKDDPRLAGPIVFEGNIQKYLPIHWTAAMLKAALLAMFDMIGYRAVLDAYGNDLRSALALYFNDKAGREDVSAYFNRFRNAAKIFGFGERPSDLRDAYRAYDFDTLNDREVLLHKTPQATLFAATCIFKINDATIAVTIPQCTAKGDTAAAVGYYERLMDDEAALPQTVQRARFTGDHWDLSPEPLRVHYVDSSDED
jgi:hypothetical protein